MALRVSQIQSLAAYFTKLSGGRVSKIIQFGKDAFAFSLPRAGRVMISLDNQNPVLYITEDKEGKTSLSTPLSAMLRKRLSGALFLGAECVNDDRVIRLRFSAVNDIFQEERLDLVLELIPTKANMALVDAEGKILAAFRPNSFTDPRPIFHGVQYEPPLKKGDFPVEEEDFDVEAYFRSCEQKQQDMLSRRKNELFQEFFRHQNGHVKSLKRKIKQIDADIEKGKSHLHDGEYGNYLFTFAEEIPQGADHFDYYGTKVPLDPLKSIHDNAEDFFKKAKKAKNAVNLGLENRAKAEKELLEATQLLNFASSADEDTLSHLVEKPSGKKQPKKKAQQSSHQLPYVVNIDGRPYYFGRSARQNDSLTFFYATKPEYLWFHLKDQFGAHVILPRINPSDEDMNIAGEIVLCLAHKNDGEVQFTEHRNIRRGGVPGQVILGSYRSASFKSVSPKVKQAIESVLPEGESK